MQDRVYYLTALLVLIIALQTAGEFQQASAALTSNTAPSTFDFNNNKLNQAEVGHMVLIEDSIANSENFAIPFLAIFEIRDMADNPTVSIGIIGGEAASNSTSNVFVSWMPNTAGNYQIKQFILNSNLQMSGVMPVVSETEITVVNNSGVGSSIHE